MFKEFSQELARQIEGEVRCDLPTREVYSVDASIYQVRPLCVVTPKSQEELIQTITLAHAYQLPITPRGAATGITGGCLGQGVVVDLSKYLTKIVEVNTEERWVICEPGVVQDDLNAFLVPYGYRLGPDTSTGNRATVGGMLANNAAGARSLKYGCMADAIQTVDVVLATGDVVTLHSCDIEKKLSLDSREGEIYRAVNAIRKQYKNAIEQHFLPIPRRASGYRLDALVKEPSVNLSRVFAGSEGSLGIAAQMQLEIVPVLKDTTLCLIYFDHLIEAVESVEALLSFSPVSLELIDHHIIEAGRRDVDWVEGTPAAIVVVEVEEHPEKIEQTQFGIGTVLIRDAEQTAAVWKLRKAGLGLLLSKRTYTRAIAFIEDLSVPPENLAPFMREFLSYMESIDKEAGIYGHLGSGCLHIRPYMNLREELDLILMEQMMRDVSDLVKRYRGSLSGEHGDGRVRSWLNPSFFGTEIYDAFCELKRAFDPENLMNPGMIVEAPVVEENLRINPETPLPVSETFLDFSLEGGFSLAVEMCNGNGACRKKEGTMCPSFQATHDEYHTTRARAQMLQGILTGEYPETLSGETLHDVLDLCLSCKGCQYECPSQVDMGKMKAEVLHRYHREHGSSLRDRLFAHLPTLNVYASKVPRFSNFIASSFLGRGLAKSLGITPERSLPLLAPQRFSKMMQQHQTTVGGSPVALVVDTFTEFHSPEIGIAAVRVLEHLGCSVEIVPWACCGRTLFSKGFLEEARLKASLWVSQMEKYRDENIPLIGLEPSCVSMVRDDYRGLLGVDQKIPFCHTFDEFLAQQPCSFSLEERLSCRLHRHCHEKALTGVSPTLKVLGKISNLTVDVIPSGCCGMAGAFGYEEEHYEISKKIAHLKLIPELGKGVVIANGTSCRQQIEQFSTIKPFHLARFLERYI